VHGLLRRLGVRDAEAEGGAAFSAGFCSSAASRSPRSCCCRISFVLAKRSPRSRCRRMELPPGAVKPKKEKKVKAPKGQPQPAMAGAPAQPGAPIAAGPHLIILNGPRAESDSRCGTAS